MRISISNIAWDVDEDNMVANILKQKNINAIDIAPGKYFTDPTNASEACITSIRNWWHDKGIEVVGLQALLFGTIGLNIFGSESSQRRMLTHLKAICNLARLLGANKLVFGSPKNRDRKNKAIEEANIIAIKFFKKLGSIAADNNVIICLEPTPVCYSANFMVNSSQTAYIVKQVDHPSIRMQLDTGSLTINKELPMSVVSNCNDLIGHIHISENNLLTIGDGLTNHREIFVVLDKFLPNNILTIEMLKSKTETSVSAISRAIDLVKCKYQ